MDNGIVIGLVTSLDDPQKLNRVRVKFPHLGDTQSDWARVVTPMGGNGRGLVVLPEVDDEVLVAFEHNDVRRPYVMGALWSQTDAPPQNDGQTTSNNWRFIRSRSGHVIKLDDTSGSERIEVVDKDASRRIVIDSSGDAIRIQCDGGTIEITAGGELKVHGSSVSVTADQDMSLTANGRLTLRGATVGIN